MTTTAQPLPAASTAKQHMRPIQLPKDLRAVADLIELCFAPTLDEDGRRFIRQMRRAGQNARSYQNFHRLSPAIKGFVWEEGGQIIGNLNLIPVTVKKRRAYLVVNVAVHPNFRRRGIARALTAAGLAFAKQRGTAEAWLQVDQDNESAQHLYQSFGFTEQARRTVWHSTDSHDSHPPLTVRVTPRKRAEWKTQKYWLEQLYPLSVRWNLPINIDLFGSGLFTSLLRFLTEQNFQQWSAYKNGRWVGTLSWQSSYSQADWLWIAAPPENRYEAVSALLPNAIRDLRMHRKISANRTLAVNFPAGDAIAAFEAAGFEHHQTLIWMNKLLK